MITCSQHGIVTNVNFRHNVAENVSHICFKCCQLARLSHRQNGKIHTTEYGNNVYFDRLPHISIEWIISELLMKKNQ